MASENDLNDIPKSNVVKSIDFNDASSFTQITTNDHSDHSETTETVDTHPTVDDDFELKAVSLSEDETSNSTLTSDSHIEIEVNLENQREPNATAMTTTSKSTPTSLSTDGSDEPAPKPDPHRQQLKVASRLHATSSPVSMDASCFGCIPLLGIQDSDDDEAWLNEMMPSSAKLSYSTRRLFESKWFNMAMAINYLHQYTDTDIQEYLCVRMKAFDCQTIEFWFPQLFALYLRQETDGSRAS